MKSQASRLINHIGVEEFDVVWHHDNRCGCSSTLHSGRGSRSNKPTSLARWMKSSALSRPRQKSLYSRKPRGQHCKSYFECMATETYKMVAQPRHSTTAGLRLSRETIPRLHGGQRGASIAQRVAGRTRVQKDHPHTPCRPCLWRKFDSGKAEDSSNST